MAKKEAIKSAIFKAASGLSSFIDTCDEKITKENLKGLIDKAASGLSNLVDTCDEKIAETKEAVCSALEDEPDYYDDEIELPEPGYRFKTKINGEILIDTVIGYSVTSKGTMAQIQMYDGTIKTMTIKQFTEEYLI